MVLCVYSMIARPGFFFSHFPFRESTCASLYRASWKFFFSLLYVLPFTSAVRPLADFLDNRLPMCSAVSVLASSSNPSVVSLGLHIVAPTAAAPVCRESPQRRPSCHQTHNTGHWKGNKLQHSFGEVAGRDSELSKHCPFSPNTSAAPQPLLS